MVSREKASSLGEHKLCVSQGLGESSSTEKKKALNRKKQETMLVQAGESVKSEVILLRTIFSTRKGVSSGRSRKPRWKADTVWVQESLRRKRKVQNSDL